jgi:hypothetical protein
VQNNGKKGSREVGFFEGVERHEKDLRKSKRSDFKRCVFVNVGWFRQLKVEGGEGGEKGSFMY